MGQITTDRNLLAGILGLQTALYSESQLISAMQTWVFRKSQPIEDVLLEQRALSDTQKQFLSKLVEQYLSLDGLPPSAAITKLHPSKSLTDGLSSLNDNEVNSSVSILESINNGGGSIFAEKHSDTIAFENASQLCDNRYKILRPHARGGLGQVSVAEDLQLHREVALKQIIASYSSNAESRSRFLIEAEVTGRLEHPGIVPVYSLGFTETGPYYVMRFIRGESLKQAIDHLYARQPQLAAHAYLLELRKLVGRLIDAANAIAYAHSRGVLHRDIKPSNIMLGKYGETLVVDWGLAKTGTQKPAASSSDEPTFVPLSGDSSSETRMGSVVGTLAYMSPEQANGRLDLLSQQSDVYSLGATLYCILAGEAPFDIRSQDDMLLNVREGRFAPPMEKNGRIPKALNAVCMKAMATRLEDRYGSVSSLLDDIELWLADEPVSVYREPLFVHLARSAKRHRLAVGVACAVVLTTMVGLFLLNVLTQRQNAVLKVARDDAHKAKNLAEENLTMARNLAVLLWKNAEEKLSAPEFINNAIARKLRSEMTEASLSTIGKILEKIEPDGELLHDYAKILRISGNLKRLERDFETANERTLKSLELQQRIPSETLSEDRADYLSETFRDLGTLRKAEGKIVAAQRAFAAAKSLAVNLLTKYRESIPYQRSVATIELEEIGLLEDLGKTEESLEMALSCSKRFQAIRKSDQKEAKDIFLSLFAEARIISLLGQLGRYNEAEQAAQKSIELGRPILGNNKNDGNTLVPFARILYESAENLMNANEQPEVAGQRLDEAVKSLSDLVPNTKLASHMSALAAALLQQARFYRNQSKFTDAETMITKANEWMDKLVKASPSPGYLSELSEILQEAGKIKTATGELPAAIRYLQLAKTRQEEACQQSKENVAFKLQLGSITRELDQLQNQR